MSQVQQKRGSDGPELDDYQITYSKISKRNRLILEAKPDERFMLFDSVSGFHTTIKVFYRNNGNLAIAFEAPKAVRISREQQRSVECPQKTKLNRR